MGFLILLPFAALWYLPLFIKHRKTVLEKGRYYIFALLMGIVAFIAAVIVQGVCNLATANIKPTGAAYEIYSFIKILLSVAVVEELLKFFFGWLIVKKVPDLTEAGSMLILGMAGLGFELIESVQADLLSGVLRGLTALHLFYQMWMGKYWWQAKQAGLAGDIPGRKKLLRKAFLVPICMHALFDYPILRISKLTDQLENESTATTVLIVAAIAAAVLFGIGCLIYLLKCARRTLKEEKAAHDALLAEAEQAAAEGQEETPAEDGTQAESDPSL